MAGEHAGHRQRMKERFLRNGLDGFADHEVLELLLFYAIPRQNTNPLAHRLLKHFGSLHGVLDASLEELSRIEGMGTGAATLLKLIAHTERRLEKSRSGAVEVMKNRGDAQRHCMQLFRGLRQEHFYVVCLNAQMQVLGDALISQGTLDEVQAYPRQVAEAIVRYNAHSVVLCHNHPGGDAIPSRQDMEVTRSLVDLCASLSVKVLDHIIVTETEAFSMVSCGLLLLRNDQEKIDVHVADPAGEVLIRSKLRKQMQEGKKQKTCEKAPG